MAPDVLMANEKRFPRLRATFRNSVVWGVVWGTFGTAVASVMRLIDKIPFGYALLDGLGMGIRIGVMGAIASAAFFAFISVAYRGKRLSEISWLRFGAGGAIVAGLFVPGVDLRSRTSALRPASVDFLEVLGLDCEHGSQLQLSNSGSRSVGQGDPGNPLAADVWRRWHLLGPAFLCADRA